jgi:aminoglycoside phosphotransferase (APT) family kinase protein
MRRRSLCPARASLYGVPRVLGLDEQGREILDYLPGESYAEQPPDDILAAAMRWLREYHRAVASYRPEGVVQWRTSLAEMEPGQIVCMHDFGYYNWIGDENGFVGVIDWDMAGPGVPLDDPAFAAWNIAAYL